MTRAKPLHMQFCDTSFIDYDCDHEGYHCAFMSLTAHRQEKHIETARKFFAKYADDLEHKHGDLCARCLAALEKSL